MTDKELIYLKVGQILNIAQAIEYNLCYIILYDNILRSCFSKEEVITKLKNKNEYYEELKHKPTGYSLDYARRYKIFEEEFVNSLSKIVSTRNYYAHEFFKKTFESNDLESNSSYYLKKLDKDINRLNDMNKELGTDLNTLIKNIKIKIS